jgi:transcriptional regulator with PAS, ATPase and Fis domain
MHTDWFNGITIAITVSDADGKIIEMNDASAKVFEKYGGRELIGQKLNNCHNPNSIEIMGRLLSDGATNVYTIEKKGQKKMIFQAPWHQGGKIAGLIEFSFVIPAEMPHFIRE